MYNRDYRILGRVDNATAAALRQHARAMAADLIVSYDGTPNDDDALALGKLLARTGATVALAYVRHRHEDDADREQIAQHDSEQLLERGAVAFGDPEIARHVLVDPSTPVGLTRLAEREGASMIVFGSDYRTSPGRAEPGTSAQHLLDGGPFAIAVAAAGLRALDGVGLGKIAVSPPDADTAASRTADVLAGKLGATLVAPSDGADLIVVASRPDGLAGRIDLSGAARATLNAVRGSVVVVPCGLPPHL